MKKFIIACVILFIINLSCKKVDEGGKLCACSPLIETPYLRLVIKNTNGDDLLNPTTAGFIAENQIQLFYKDANGINKDVNFLIRAPFDYGKEKFAYYQLYSTEIVGLKKNGINNFYFKIGQNTPYEIKFDLTAQLLVNKLSIDNTPALQEMGLVTKFWSGNIYYLIR